MSLSMSNPSAVLEFRQRPSVAAYMARAMLPVRASLRDRSCTGMSAQWHDLRISREHLQQFEALTGLSSGTGLSLVYPHVFGFPLLMALITHPRFLLPIWQALQVRNHFLRHRAMPVDARYDLVTTAIRQRILAKGLEVDLLSQLTLEGECVWEGLTTFYYRGRYGAVEQESPLAQPPVLTAASSECWHMPSGVGLAFGKLTGDFNGIHLWNAYARKFGFAGAFHHPQLVLAQCEARLPIQSDLVQAGAAQRLDVWLKGPVFYDSDVYLVRQPGVVPSRIEFSVTSKDETRPAMVGIYRTGNSKELALLLSRT